MARTSPTPGQKIIYFIFIILGVAVLYTDINTKLFSGIKNNFQSLKISSVYVIKNISVNPVRDFIQLIQAKQKLMDENKELREKLDETYLKNFLISKENTFYIDHTKMIKLINDNASTESFHLAKLGEINPNIFNCCDRHRIYIEILDKNKEDFIESSVFNLNGIIGQVVGNASQNEVILLTDTKSSIPIKNLKGDFFCNGIGSGKEGLISCNYSQLVWTGNHQIGELFYSSGLGGVYPKDIKVGELISIDIVDNSNTKLEIKLIASPLESDLFGVIKI